MDRPTQFIVTGFHRSGTSMTMQALKRAGLHIGNALIGADPSNPDGHFEDIETVNLHDKWLAESGIDWCCTWHPPTVSIDHAQTGIDSIVDRLGKSHTQWGIKDPRAALFLNTWFDVLDNPHGVFVYRHFASCLMSLQRRQADELFLSPSTEARDIRFWAHPETALQSWLVHNKAILAQLKAYPDRCILISQEAQIAGSCVSTLVAETLPLKVLTDVANGVDMAKTRTQETVHIHNEQCQHELQDTWEELQSLSIAPADVIPTVEWGTSLSDPDEQLMRDARHRLSGQWDKLGVQSI